ncbi:MAG: PorV/PorQ family protein [Elusimicrobia bacterium]|nr:PorV/PorQ family protein [Elusimicrobiota bacterium]
MRLRAFQAALLAALVAAVSPFSASAGDGAGSSGAEFLAIGVGARPAGLAESFSGVADNVHALAYNPGGLAFLHRREIGLDHDYYAAGINHEWLGYAHPTAWGTFGGAANLVFVSPFESYSEVDNPTGKTSAADASYQLTFATTLTEKLGVGATIKRVSSRLHETTASTFAGDLGVLWKPASRLRLGASMLHLGPGLRYIAVTENLPRTMRGGLAWNAFDPADFRHSLTLAFDVSKRSDEPARLGGGIEGTYDSVLALRIGGRTSPASGTGMTLGMGIYLFRDETRDYEIDFDYAFVAAGDFSTSHRAGLTFKFGDPITSAPRAAELRKSDLYYEDAARPKARRKPKIYVPAPRPSTRPSTHMPSYPNDFQWINP